MRRSRNLQINTLINAYLILCSIFEHFLNFFCRCWWLIALEFHVIMTSLFLQSTQPSCFVHCTSRYSTHFTNSGPNFCSLLNISGVVIFLKEITYFVRFHENLKIRLIMKMNNSGCVKKFMSLVNIRQNFT